MSNPTFVDLPALACSAAIEVDHLILGNHVNYKYVMEFITLLGNLPSLKPKDLIAIRTGFLEMSKEASRQQQREMANEPVYF